MFHLIFWKILEDAGVGVKGVWGDIFISNFDKIVAQELRIIILLHLRNFSISLCGKTRPPIIFMVFGRSGRVHDFQNQLFLTLGTPSDSK